MEKEVEYLLFAMGVVSCSMIGVMWAVFFYNVQLLRFFLVMLLGAFILLFFMYGIMIYVEGKNGKSN